MISYQEVRSFCLSLPGATEDIKWDDDLTFSISGKMFTVMNTDSSKESLCFKVEPELFDQLIGNPEIKPAPYLGRFSWVQVQHFNVLDKDTLLQLIKDSYHLIWLKLPKKKRPVRTDLQN